MSNVLAIVVMAHPDRKGRAELLAEHVDADTIVFDWKSEGEWPTGARAWREGARVPGATHVLVLQDDAIPVDDLRAHLMARIDAEPHAPISLYLGRVKPTRWAHNVLEAVRQANFYEARWLSATHLLHGVGVVMPSAWVTPMLDACEMSPLPYDQRIGRYLRQSRGQTVLYTWPSLVDHDDAAPSLVLHADDHRVATSGRVAYRVGIVPEVTATVVHIDTPRGADR